MIMVAGRASSPRAACWCMLIILFGPALTFASEFDHEMVNPTLFFLRLNVAAEGSRQILCHTLFIYPCTYLSLFSFLAEHIFSMNALSPSLCVEDGLVHDEEKIVTSPIVAKYGSMKPSN